MSEAQDQAYFAEGLSEEILNLLAQSTTLRVTARTSSFSFKGRSVDIATIADTLKTTHVLEGSVRKSGNLVRITAQLVDGANSVHVWSQTYDRDVADVFGVQDEIAAAVAESLQVTLTGNSTPQSGPRISAAAFERYLQGKYFYNRRGESDVARAKEYFEQALEVDPDYARAWAGLAGVYQIARQQGLQGALPAWRAAVDQALKLGPNLAESHVRAAQYYWWAGDRETSVAHCKRAIALNPSDPLVLAVSAGRSFSQGHWSEGIALQRRAVQVDPLSATGRGNLGAYLAAIGEWEEAIAELEKARELSPTLDRIDSDIARVQILRQRFDEALAVAARMPAGPARDQCIALTHRAPGQQAAADAALARLVAVASGPDREPAVDISIAEVYAFRGDEDQALKWLTRALQQSSGRNWTREEMTQSPFLKSLHGDARWPTLLASAENADAHAPGACWTYNRAIHAGEAYDDQAYPSRTPHEPGGHSRQYGVPRRPGLSRRRGRDHRRGTNQSDSRADRSPARRSRHQQTEPVVREDLAAGHGHVQEMNEVWDKWVVQGSTPARATVGARLAGPQYLIEIAAIAAIG